MFTRCSIHCTHCATAIATTNVTGRLIPRKQLHRTAREKGAVKDQGGRWYCGPLCRTAFRLEHDTSHRETPKP